MIVKWCSLDKPALAADCEAASFSCSAARVCPVQYFRPNRLRICMDEKGAHWPAGGQGAFLQLASGPRGCRMQMRGTPLKDHGRTWQRGGDHGRGRQEIWKFQTCRMEVRSIRALPTEYEPWRLTRG